MPRRRKDMIAVRIAPDMRMAAVATPAYLEQNGVPREPQDQSSPAFALVVEALRYRA